MITHLVDSDWTIDYLKGKSGALERVNALIANRALSTSIIVVGEVLEGAVHNDAALRQYEKVLRGVEILDVDRAVASTYAELRSSLRAAGQLMSDNTSGSPLPPSVTTSP